MPLQAKRWRWPWRWVGHLRVVVLDRGLQAWIAEGGKLVLAEPRDAPGERVPRSDDARWIGTEVLVAGLAAGRVRVVEDRAPGRFRGECEPMDPVAGHIPGAIDLPLAGNLGADGRFLEPTALRARFAQAMGDTAPTRIIQRGGSGVTACRNLLAMEMAGLHVLRRYAGSWSEWIRSPERPVAVEAG